MKSEEVEKLGKRIQKFRKEAGITQEQLAEKLRLSSKYVQFIETAHRKPSLKTLYKIAKVLNVEVKDLFA